MQSLHSQLRQSMPRLRVTLLLIGANVLIFAAMVFKGAGLWHSQNEVQLAWGANFGPATQDGEWWRLGSAVFLHFGLLHLTMNMWALWDGGQWVERMYGRARFAVIYFSAGLSGNLLSLVSHHGQAISGGASGAIFGIYGALLIYLWVERSKIQQGEFRWLFWGALGFSGVTFVFGLSIPGIDNAAHFGGLVTGMLVGTLSVRSKAISARLRWIIGGLLMLFVAVLISKIPPPTYRWRDELQIRGEIGEFLRDDSAIDQTWTFLLRQGQQGQMSFDELADRIESGVTSRYEKSFEELSALPDDKLLPSAPIVKNLLRYTERRKAASLILSQGLRTRDQAKIQQALEQVKRSASEH